MNTQLLDDFKPLGDVEFDYATLGNRFWAYLLDSLILMVPITVFTLINIIMLQSTIVAIVISLIYPTYKILMEGLYGYTLGKKWMKFKIVKVQNPSSGMDLQTAIKRYIFGYPLLITTFLATAYTFDGASLGMVKDITDWVAYHNTSQLALPVLLNYINIGATALFYIAILFIFQGEARQTLYDRFAQTVCVVEEKK